MIRSSISVRTTGQRDRAEGGAAGALQQNVRGRDGLLRFITRSTDYGGGSVGRDGSQAVAALR